MNLFLHLGTFLLIALAVLFPVAVIALLFRLYKKVGPEGGTQPIHAKGVKKRNAKVLEERRSQQRRERPVSIEIALLPSHLFEKPVFKPANSNTAAPFSEAGSPHGYTDNTFAPDNLDSNNEAQK